MTMRLRLCATTLTSETDNTPWCCSNHLRLVCALPISNRETALREKSSLKLRNKAIPYMREKALTVNVRRELTNSIISLSLGLSYLLSPGCFLGDHKMEELFWLHRNDASKFKEGGNPEWVRKWNSKNQIDVMTPESWQHQQVPQAVGELETIKHWPWSASRVGTLQNTQVLRAASAWQGVDRPVVLFVWAFPTSFCCLLGSPCCCIPVFGLISKPPSALHHWLLHAFT